LQRSDLVVLAARPGVGKTSMALTFAYEMARRGTPILFFSLEMSREQLVQRLVSMHTGVSTHKLRQNQLRHDEIPEVIRAFGEISEWPIYVEDMTDQTPLSIRTATLRHISKVGESVVMVDYLQLMEGKGRDENRVQEVSKISRGLKKLAKETNMPVLALSQLSRAVEGRTSHVPMLSDLRESGSIEQDADIVLFIYREELYDRESDKRGMAELHIAKHRNGPLGVIPLRFDNSTTRFHDLTYRTPDNY
jgi:replicative DNA helicase